MFDFILIHFLFFSTVIPSSLAPHFLFQTARKKKFVEGKWNTNAYVRMLARGGCTSHARESRKRKTAQLRNTGKICSARDRF